MPPSESLPFTHVTGRPRQAPARLTSARPAPFPPLVEQVILFGMVAAAALFWVAVIWSIVR